MRHDERQEILGRVRLLGWFIVGGRNNIKMIVDRYSKPVLEAFWKDVYKKIGRI